IVGAMKTIEYLIAQGAKVILCSHMGRPHNVLDEKLALDKKEKKKIEALPAEEQEAAKAAALEKAKGDITKLSLKIVADDLAKKGINVTLAKDVVGPDAQAKAAALKDGEVLLLENVRFHAAEEKNDPDFAKAMASLAEIYVNDAFGTAHRAHASTAGVAAYLPAVCGYLIQKEIGVMGKALADPERPFVAILGGAKVADKLNVIDNLLTKVDTLIIGGGMAYTFLAAQGYSVGTSLLDESKLEYCRNMLKKAEEKGVKLLLPIDTVTVADFPNPIDAEIETKVVPSTEIPADKMGLDIGPKTRELFAEAAKSAKTVVWNGPMGVFENPTLAQGTIAVAKALAESEAITIVGGGDSAAACEQLGFASKITHISTGGGASLEFLEGLELPGIACLLDK
ncbi:MAG: phosphoglycerate kinase, partial [Clostridia bacterium]|nr:phosphoglycerate kinase [Clostridia bacterium]